MRLIALAVLSLPLAAQAAPSLSIDGECPGLSTIEITGLTPGGNMTMLFSSCSPFTESSCRNSRNSKCSKNSKSSWIQECIEFLKSGSSQNYDS